MARSSRRDLPCGAVGEIRIGRGAKGHRSRQMRGVLDADDLSAFLVDGDQKRKAPRLLDCHRLQLVGEAAHLVGSFNIAGKEDDPSDPVLDDQSAGVLAGPGPFDAGHHHLAHFLSQAHRRHQLLDQSRDLDHVRTRTRFFARIVDGP